MLISTNQELRLHIPSNAIDDVSLLQGILDNSEHDFLMDKLGKALFDRLCEYYKQTDPLAFYQSVLDGTYQQDPWAVLLLNAQRMITNDALARFAYQQVISVNSSGVNVVSGNDYGAADDRLLERGVSSYKKEAFVALNNLLTTLETWAKAPNAAPVPEAATVPDGSPSGTEATEEIITLWAQSHYYYLHGNLLIQSCSVLQRFVDIYESRERFIRLLPDLHFIQDEYISDAIGEDLVTYLLSAEAIEDKTERKSAVKLKQKVRRLMVSYLEQRTTVLSIDKARRQQAHDESVALKANLVTYLRASQKSLPEDVAKQCPFYAPELWQEPEPTPSATATTESRTGQQGKTFRTRLMY